MHDALDDQIEAYQVLLPEIREHHGSVWALVAHKKLIQTFSEFAEAAAYVIKHLANEQVLIRHTDERPESAPFIRLG